MSRSLVLAPGEFYHLYNRGTEKRRVFVNKSDYDRFVALLYLCNGTNPVRIDNLRQRLRQGQQGRTLLDVAFSADRGKPLVDIVAYCLMPNHFHIVAYENRDGGISEFIQKLTTAYTMYFNTRMERSGALFQGKYRATHVGDDRYLSYLISYVHLNPVKLNEPRWKEAGIANRARAEKFLDSYRFSSFLDYTGPARVETAILNKDALPSEKTAPEDFKNAVREWLEYSRKSKVRP